MDKTNNIYIYIYIYIYITKIFSSLLITLQYFYLNINYPSTLFYWSLDRSTGGAQISISDEIGKRLFGRVKRHPQGAETPIATQYGIIIHRYVVPG